MKIRLSVVPLGLLATGVAIGQDQPLPRAEIDRHVVQVLYQVAEIGTEVYNRGNFEGCYRLYEGSLLGVEPFLGHRPRLQQLIRDKLRQASRQSPEDAAHQLREAIDAVILTIAPPKNGAAKQTLWQRIGGEPVMKAVIDDFLNAAVKNPKVNLDRNGKYKFDAEGLNRQKKLWLEFFSALSGGPLSYSGQPLNTVHRDMKITEEEFNALVETFQATLEKHKIPPTEAKELVFLLQATRPLIVESKKVRE